MSLRVIAGRLSGRRLKTPSHEGYRPSGDQVRGALFSILGERVAEGPFLDLFSGSGAVAIEAWSRGAPRVVFVERDRGAVRVLEGNLDALGIDRGAEVLAADAIAALRALAHRRRQFSTIFADPPYEYPRYPRLLRAVAESALLPPGGLFVLEHRARTRAPDAPTGFRVSRASRYGDTILTFYEREGAPGSRPGGAGEEE